MSVVEYDNVLSPYDDEFVTSLHTLCVQVFGAVKRDNLLWTLENMPDVSVQTARADRLVGFKLGHALTAERYTSSLGGVHEDYRRKGIAQRLMRNQHEWVQARGFLSIETGAINTNDAMLALNSRLGFHVIGTYCRTDLPRIMMYKEF